MVWQLWLLYADGDALGKDEMMLQGKERIIAGDVTLSNAEGEFCS